MRLYHFSEEPAIRVFDPRPPLRHPESEALVYAIEDAWSPLYFFPRDCPRIGVCEGGKPVRLLIDARFEDLWRNGRLFRYEFDPAGFMDCKDHGVFVATRQVLPIAVELLEDLPGLVAGRGIQTEIVASLTDAAAEFYDFEERTFRCREHVSMIRMALLPDWPFEGGGPVVPNRDSGI